jgi:hypothetical protein
MRIILRPSQCLIGRFTIYVAFVPLAWGSLAWLPHVIECVLNHLSGFRAGVAEIYNRNSYQPEMREALTKWAAHVDAITSPSGAITVS